MTTQNVNTWWWLTEGGLLRESNHRGLIQAEIACSFLASNVCSSICSSFSLCSIVQGSHAPGKSLNFKIKSQAVKVLENCSRCWKVFEFQC